MSRIEIINKAINVFISICITIIGWAKRGEWAMVMLTLALLLGQFSQ